MVIDGLQRRLPGVGKETEEGVGAAAAHWSDHQQPRKPISPFWSQEASPLVCGL